MSETSPQHNSGPLQAGLSLAGGAGPQDDRRFRFWLLIATAVHALFLISFSTAAPRRLGDPRGGENAISVDFVSEADLKANATVNDTAAGRPAPPPSPARAPSKPAPAAAQTPPAAEPAPQPPAQPEAKPQPTEAAPVPAPVPAAATSETAEAVDKPELRPTLTTPEPAPPVPEATPQQKKPDQPAKPVEQPQKAAEKPPEKPPPKPAEKPQRLPRPAEDKPHQPSQTQTRTAKLDLAPPATPSYSVSAGNGGAGIERPAGATRSGANDDFARGVIRALQRTMPQLTNTLGRVTVRIELDRNGNLVNTIVLRPSSVAGLDQSVVFATRQSSFPLPPNNSKPDDLVFFVTYIYR